MSSAYRSLHINTSRRVMAFKTLPMPDHYPDYPNHFQMAAYFDEYVDHFGLREKIRFRTEVIERRAAGRGVGGDRRGSPTGSARRIATAPSWSPTATTGTRAGRSRPSRGPTSSPASRSTSTTTASPTCCAGKRVLVLGIGNSATDIAVESSRIADATFLAMRRGAYVLPKYMNGKPIDEASTPLTSRLPLPVQRFFSMRDARHRRRRHDHLRPAQARPQAVRGAPDGLLGAAAAARPRRHRGQAQHRPLHAAAAPSASPTAARRRSTSSSTAPATR